jgi:hypothetical protein
LTTLIAQVQIPAWPRPLSWSASPPSTTRETGYRRCASAHQTEVR